MNDSKNTQQNQGNPALCPELRTTDLIPPFDTVSMKPKKATATVKSETLWTKAPVANLVRYESSGIYFVRAKVRGKLIRKSLETNVLSVAKQRLADVLDAEHRSVAPRSAKIVGKMTFAAGLAIFQQRQKQNPELKPRSVEYNERIAESLLKTWPSLAETDMKKITKEDCMDWRARFGQKYAATVTNGALSILRRVLDIGIEAGVRYDNPAKAKEVKRARVRQKELRLPEPDQFIALVEHVRGNGSGRGGHSADAIQFFSYCGPRLNEAKRIFGRDCDFTRGEIVIRGDPETGTKNWEIRRVPMIPEMRKLLERLKAERGDQEFLKKPVCHVRKFNRSLKNACKKLGLHHLTHHDLRHLFATRCIESGVPIPTVAKWLGHKDGGVLAMQTYGHLRDKHSADMAQKVVFSESTSAPSPTEPKPVAATAPTPANVLQLPPKEQQGVNGDHKKAIAKAKAKYKFPWWASANPLEVFWGQVNEEVRIVPFEKYLEAAKAAMEREVFAQELAEPHALIDEFVERISAKTFNELSAKIPAREMTVQERLAS
jgi:integrase